MNERLIKLRKKLHITQQEFADRLNVSRSTIATYEVGKSNPSDAAVTLICREFNVSEDWLRNGNGDMFLPVDRENEISRMVKALLSDEGNTFKSRFITMLAGLSVSDWERLESEARKLLDASAEISAAGSEVMTVEDAEAAYIKSRSQNVQKTDASVMNTTVDTKATNKIVNQ